MTDILRIQDEAQDRGFDSAEFFISAPKGVFSAKWLDAYFGFFRIDGINHDGTFSSVQDIKPPTEAFWELDEAEEHNERVFSALRPLLAALETQS